MSSRRLARAFFTYARLGACLAFLLFPLSTRGDEDAGKACLLFLRYGVLEQGGLYVGLPQELANRRALRPFLKEDAFLLSSEGRRGALTVLDVETEGLARGLDVPIDKVIETLKGNEDYRSGRYKGLLCEACNVTKGDETTNFGRKPTGPPIHDLANGLKVPVYGAAGITHVKVVEKEGKTFVHFWVTKPGQPNSILSADSAFRVAEPGRTELKTIRFSDLFPETQIDRTTLVYGRPE